MGRGAQSSRSGGASEASQRHTEPPPDALRVDEIVEEVTRLTETTDESTPDTETGRRETRSGDYQDRSAVKVPEELQRFLNSAQAAVEAAGEMMTQIGIKFAQENARGRDHTPGERADIGEQRGMPQHERLLDAARDINRSFEQWQEMAAAGQRLPWNNRPMPPAPAAVQPMPAFNPSQARDWAVFAANAARIAQAFANHAAMAASGAALAEAAMPTFLSR